MNEWSEWYPFSTLYEYYGLIDDLSDNNRSTKTLTYLGKTGKPHQDDGFRLRSNPSPASAASTPLKHSLESLPCPLEKGDIGCYWIKIAIPDQLELNYIGQCTERTWGISKRLTDHFRKLCAIPDSSEISWEQIRGISPTKRFSSASQKIKVDLGMDLTDPKTAFFERFVKVKFIKVPASKTADKKIHRIEGMALAAYKAQFGLFPELNDKDETIGLEGFLP